MKSNPDDIAERQRNQVVDFLDWFVPLLFIVLGLAVLVFMLVSFPLIGIMIALVIVSFYVNVIMNRL